MYRIYANDICFYDDVIPLDNRRVINPKLILEDSAAGSLTVTIPPTNIAYNTIKRMTTDISVKKDGKEIWAGRVLSESKDFWNNRVLLCEGELAFLNDSTQPPTEYKNKTVRGFLEALINNHNAKVAANRKFTIGAVTVTDSDSSVCQYTNYEKTIECINKKLVERLGGHLRVRKENGVRYLDYLKDYPNTNSQTIEFGKNLLDFTREWDLSEFATVILPLGNRLDESPIEELDAYLTVKSVNGGSIYVKSSNAVSTYGWIEKVVNWDDVSDASVLLTKAKAYLSDIQFDDMNITLSALDLHYLNVQYEAVKLLDEIRVISKPHGMDRYFPVTKLEIMLDQPENTQFTLGDRVRTSLTSTNNKINSAILGKLDNIPKKSAILEEAKANATAIMNMATNGYITITNNANGTNELYVSNNPDYTKATKLWKWNLNGLGYSKDGGKTYGLAITMDGSIVADYITTGTLNADLIKSGTLNADLIKTGTLNADLIKTGTLNASLIKTGTLNADLIKTGTINADLIKAGSINADLIKTGSINADLIKTGTLNANLIKTGTLKDANSNVTFDLSNGTLTMKKGSIDIGSGKFTVATNGYLTSTYGKIGGFTITESSIYNDIINLKSDGLILKRDSVSVGRIGTNVNKQNSNQRGLVMDLEYQGNYITWAAKRSSGATEYSMKLTYVNQATSGFDYADRLYLGCAIDGQGYEAHNFLLNPDSSGAKGGLTSTLNFVQILEMNSDGTVAKWSKGCKMVFKKGFLTGGAWTT